jgi:hypothetical protein
MYEFCCCWSILVSKVAREIGPYPVVVLFTVKSVHIIHSPGIHVHCPPPPKYVYLGSFQKKQNYRYNDSVSINKKRKKGKGKRIQDSQDRCLLEDIVFFDSPFTKKDDPGNAVNYGLRKVFF